ncbi:MAG: ATP-binding cassette domain-containing protein [Actinobacteria bacterium]|uniref:Unannotated protein n=1 Tax=freshwater metagenome TaxID=449393 RepID=A0A6J7KY76_9ZZZZ|nr:ATP-binding cassette domain-containing protein [Actinomycetota bacterium]
MTDIAVDVQGLSVAYRVYARRRDLLTEVFLRRNRHDDYWALRNCTFRVPRGQRMGIIGRNGAGKSTLLRVISGALGPTSGIVDVRGSVAVMNGAVPAWNGDQTGIDLTRLNLRLKGYSRERIDHFLDDIIDFTELGAHLHMPLKTYSSGMQARLSFAIATSVDSDIVIIDEVLGAGDGYFAAKAAQRLRALCDDGRTLLFVSHSTHAVRSMCDSVLWLEDGEVRAIGPTVDLVPSYELELARAADQSIRVPNSHRASAEIHLMREDDVPNPATVRVRLRRVDIDPSASCRIRDLTATWITEKKSTTDVVPLDNSSGGSPHELRLWNSAWGRLHTRSGLTSRELLSHPGGSPGGQICLAVHGLLPPGTRLAMRWTCQTSLPAKDLVLEILDVEFGRWTAFTQIACTPGDGGKFIFTAQTDITSAHTSITPMTVSAVVRPRCRIADVRATGADSNSNAIDPMGPLTLTVVLDVNEYLRDVFLVIEIYRTDGTLMYFQSSSEVLGEVSLSSGRHAFQFSFDSNPFGDGEYTITSTALAGIWAPTMDQSAAEVFDRSIETGRFSIPRRANSLHGGVTSVRAVLHVSDIGADDHQIGTQQA